MLINTVTPKDLTTPRTPGANTVAYYPLTADTSDASGNGNNMTNSGITFGTYDGVDCGYFNSSYAYKSGNPLTGNPTFTVSVRAKYINNSSGRNLWGFGNGGNNYSFCMWVVSGRLNTGGWSNDRDTGYDFDSAWHHVVWSYSNGSGTIYIDGQSVYSSTWSPNIQSTRICIGANANRDDKWYGYLSKVIFENKERTAQEIGDYYDQTKSDYGY